MAEKKPPTVPSKSSRPASRIPATFDLRQPLIVLRSHLLVAVALALVICTLVAWQQMRRPKMYAASATLFLDRGERLDMSDRAEMGVSEMNLLTRMEQLRSPEMRERVVASLQPEERALVARTPEASKASPETDRMLSVAVRSAVSVERRLTTTLIDINVVHRDPQIAALLANRFADQAIRYAFDRSSATSDASLTFLRGQAEDMRKKAEAAERVLQEYRQRFNLVSLEDNQNIIVDNLKSLNASATAAQVARLAAEAKLEQAEAVLKRGDNAAQLAAVTGFQSLGDVARQIAELKGKRAVMAQRYGALHPAMLENERTTNELEKVQEERVKTAMSSLRDQLDRAVTEQRQLDQQRAKAEKAALDLDQIGVEYNILRRAVESHKASYSQLLSRLNDAAISAQLRGVNLKISELATPPNVPYSPNPRKTLLITAALAIAILLGYPFSVEMFFGRIRSASDIEYHLGGELLGEVGSVSRMQEKDRPLLVKSELDEAAAEQFRALYSQLLLVSRIDPPKTILITSTLPGEGKSFIAANLAECFIAHGRRTLLVDADLRRPTQHRNFGLDNKAGIVRWIEEGGDAQLDPLKDVRLGIVEIMPSLFLLRAGGVSRKATELMETARLPGLLAALQREFDIVILDTPPAGAFPDAIGFARVCHELIYICRFNTASRQAVREVLQRMRQTGLEFPGVVLNAMPSGFAGGYYYRGYSYQQAKHYSKRYRQPKA